jgi:SAM-dependent methyltransferase
VIADPATSAKVVAPAAERNKGPILDVLRGYLGATAADGRQDAPASILEVASGSGQHAAAIVAALPHVTVQPTDCVAAGFPSIAAYRDELPPAVSARLRDPVLLDAADASSWARLSPSCFDAVLCVNMLHIAPPECTPGLLAGAARVLRPGGLLFIYGPFTRHGAFTTDSNAAFDAKLKSMDPRYGLRDLDAIVAEAAAASAGGGERPGLAFEAAVDMPANNFTLVLRKVG